jgi:hypothetical protein
MVRVAATAWIACAAGIVAAADPWPAEPIGSAVNLTPIEGPVPNEFYTDMSACSWNPTTRRLWVARNKGPSKFWAIVEDGAGSFKIDERSGNRGEWSGFGDLESLTQANLSADIVYLMIEGEERIKSYDVSVYGTATLLDDWDVRPFLPLAGEKGAEGFTFVPDSYLSAAGFVDNTGALYTSTEGLGGLMLVGHQNGGGVFAFDLNPTTGGFKFVGEYRTSYDETAGLEFDRSTGLLWVWHSGNNDTLEKMSLASTSVGGQSYRNLVSLKVYNGPDHMNNEGIALMGTEDCVDGKRSFFMATDNGGAQSLTWYRDFTDGCSTTPGPPPPENVRRADKK